MMGKKNDGPSIHSRMVLGGYDRELERFGIEGPRLGRSDGNQEYRSAEQVEKEIIEAARNDYDLRATMNAAARSGKNKAIELEKKGFKDIGDVTNWMNFSEKAAKRHGQGGDFGSASDYMGLTKSMEIRDRRKQTEEYSKMFASTDDVNSLREDLENQEQFVDYRHKPIEKSDALARAEERVAEYDNNGPISIYGNNNKNAPTSNGPKDATSSFLYDYRQGLTNKYGSPRDEEAELLAAAKIVQGAQNS